MNNSKRYKSPFVRTLFIIAGSLSVALGVLGMLLPVLPTTPFLLLAAWFYIRSSDRFYYWLINHKIWGKYLRGYLAGEGIPKRIKVWAIILLWATILSTVFFALEKNWLKILLIAIAVAVSIHIININGKNQEK
ncbi:MAG: YbaN family protein [Bacteroidales bacterium]